MAAPPLLTIIQCHRLYLVGCCVCPRRLAAVLIEWRPSCVNIFIIIWMNTAVMQSQRYSHPHAIQTTTTTTLTYGIIVDCCIVLPYPACVLVVPSIWSSLFYPRYIPLIDNLIHILADYLIVAYLSHPVQYFILNKCIYLTLLLCTFCQCGTFNDQQKDTYSSTYRSPSSSGGEAWERRFLSFYCSYKHRSKMAVLRRWMRLCRCRRNDCNDGLGDDWSVTRMNRRLVWSSWMNERRNVCEMWEEWVVMRGNS